MDTLTDRQAEILRLVRELTEVSGYPPTRAEIAERMGFRSVNSAEQHLRALEKKGAIEITSGSSRGIRVKDAPRSSARLDRLLELPVIIEPGDYAAWLNANNENPKALLRPYPDSRMEAYPVSLRVNSPANDDSSLVERLDSRP